MPDKGRISITTATTATSTAAGRLSREATAAAYQHHLVAKGDHTGAWDSLADLFAADATYSDVFYGEMRGQEAIRDFLRESMKGIEDWSFPVQWALIDEGQVVVHWMNRLPGARPDGSFYEFPGISAITYGLDGKITRQMDIYDGIQTLKIVAEAKTGAVGRAVRGAAGWVGPQLREGVRALYRGLDVFRK